jgi:hypothetical protein
VTPSTPDPVTPPTECAKSPTKGHCDHKFGFAHYTEPQTFQCCHCGRSREEKPLPSGGAYMYHPDDHGPFAPKIRAMYSTENPSR